MTTSGRKPCLSDPKTGAVLWKVCIVCSLLLSLLPGAARGQTYYGTIRGTVLDSSGAVTPGVNVIVTNIDTNISQKVTSNEVGNYVVPNLIPGTYRVTAEPEGFKKFVANDIQLVATADRRVDVHLEVGTATQSITVNAGAQLIETEKNSLSAELSNEEFTYIPVNSTYRSIWNLATLTPTAVNGTYGGAGDGGQYGYNTNFTIDGIPAKDGWSGWTFGPMLTYIDSYSEIKINVSGSDASSPTPSEVAVYSQSGTNQFHGEAWMHYNAVGFEARDFFNTGERPHGPPTFRPNVNIGGPVIIPKLYNGKDRTFFYFTWQGLRGSQAPQVVNIVVPDAGLRTGQFPAYTLNASGQQVPLVITDPLTGKPFPGNLIPSSRISPVATYYQNTFYPTGSFSTPGSTETDQYRNVKAFGQGNNYYAARIDQKLGTKNSLYVRFLYAPSIPSGWWDSNDPLIGVATQWRDETQQIVSDTHVISPSVVNEFRFGHSVDNSFYSGANAGRAVVQASGLQLTGNLPDVPAMPAMNIAGYNPLSQTAEGGWKWDTYHFQEALHVVKGKQNLTFGAQISQYNGTMYPTSPSAVYGTFGFDGRFSGDPYADFLLGLPDSSARQTSVSPTYPHELNKEFYATDDWKVTPRLTLNLGLRYALLDPGTIDKNVIANFNIGAKALVIPASAQSLVAPEYVVSDTPLVTNTAVGLSNKLLNIQKRNFAPRFGFAWRPPSIQDFVVRGGVGIYYVDIRPFVSEGGGAPYEIAENYTNTITGGVPLFNFPAPFPVSPTVTGSGGFSASGMDPNLPTPYSVQANLTLEKQVHGMGISLSYLNTDARRSVFYHNLNAVQANTIPFATKEAEIPYPFFYSISYANVGGRHNYNAAYIKAERRFHQGLYYESHLTWARTVGDDVAANEDPYNRARDRAMSASIPPVQFMASALYDLPFGKGKRFGTSMPTVLDRTVGGWRVNLNYQWQNGSYFTPSFYGSDPSNTNTFSGRPDRIANGNLPKGQRTLDRYFDTSAFAPPPADAGRFGTSAPNILEGPGQSVLNAGLTKEILLRENVKLKLDVVSTNVLNHPNFGTPDGAIEDSTYGMLTYSALSQRNFSFTARLSF